MKNRVSLSLMRVVMNCPSREAESLVANFSSGYFKRLNQMQSL
jgi:hypothetical protein